MKAFAPDLSKPRLPVRRPAKVVAGLFTNKVAAVALALVTVPALTAKLAAVVLVRRATAWLLPLRSSTPPLTTRSITVGVVAVGVTSSVLGPAARIVVPSFWKNCAVFRLR